MAQDQAVVGDCHRESKEGGRSRRAGSHIEGGRHQCHRCCSRDSRRSAYRSQGATLLRTRPKEHDAPSRQELPDEPTTAKRLSRPVVARWQGRLAGCQTPHRAVGRVGPESARAAHVGKYPRHLGRWWLRGQVRGSGTLVLRHRDQGCQEEGGPAPGQGAAAPTDREKDLGMDYGASPARPRLRTTAHRDLRGHGKVGAGGTSKSSHVLDLS